MVLRRLNKDDAEALFGLRLSGLETAPTAFGTAVDDEKIRGISFFENILSSPGEDNVIFGALVDSHLVGMVGVQRTTRTKERHKANVWGMYVAIGHRQKGIGAGLIDLTISHARDKMKTVAIYLSVESSNIAARKLYESRGFKHWGTEPRALFVGQKYYDETHMVLDF